MNKLIIKSDYFIPEKRRKEIEKEIEENLASDSKFLFLPNGLNFKILQGKAEAEFKWIKRTDYTYQAAGAQEVKKYIYKLLNDATAEQLAAIAEDYLKKRERLENTIGTVRKYGANVLYQTGKLEKIRKEVTESSWPTTLQVYINRSFAFLIRYPQEERP